MSQQLISRSEDLSRLRADGYNVEVVAGHLLVRDVPFLGPDRAHVRGTLVKPLTLSGDVADYQGDHTILLTGPAPCDTAGTPLNRVIHSAVQQEPVPGVVASHLLSNKPSQGYRDYYELVTTYIAILTKYAHDLDGTLTAQTYPPVQPDGEEDSPFVYVDTASALAGITSTNAKLKGHRIAVVGLGGTGAYILDQVAKTPVAEIHLYDGDQLMQHNAFRYPGAISLDVVAAKPNKVDYFAQQYGVFRRGITAHAIYVTGNDAAEMMDMDFVFLAVDDNPSRSMIARRLEAANVPFIDVGMGLYLTDGRIGGQTRVTTSTDGHRDHLWDARRRLPTSVSPDDLYNQNVQIADMNALNAALAVTRWKKHVGIYVDLEGEYNSLYAIDGNETTNEDH